MKRIWEISAKPTMAYTPLIGTTLNSGGYTVNNKLTNHTLFGVTMSFAALICLCAANVQAQTSSSVHSGIIYRNPRVYNVEYFFELSPNPNRVDRAKDLKLWIPIPREWESQKAVKIISVQPEPHAKYVDPEYGNPMLFWDFGKEPEESSYRVEIKYRLESYEIHTEIDPNKIGPYDKTSKEYTLYTKSTHTVSITPKVRELAQIAVGAEKNPYLQAKHIFDFVRKKMRYKAGRKKRGVKPILDSPVKDEKTGEEYYEGACGQYSAFYVALCRADGIPARSVVALSCSRPWINYGGLGGHRWAEIFIPDYGWIPVDPTYNSFGHLDNGYIIVSKNRDIRIGPYTPESQDEGYGTVGNLLNNGKADLLCYTVRNIAKVDLPDSKIVHNSDPFPADALAEYVAKFYPETEAEKNLALYRKRALRWIDQNTREHTDKIAALAHAYKKEPRARYEHEAFICHMLRKLVGDKKFSDIFETYTDLRVKSGKPVSTARFEKIAEDIYSQPLDWFFKQWIGYTELPQLQLDAVTFSEDEKGWHVRGNLRQLNSSLFRLSVELLLETEITTEHKTLWLENRNTNFEFSTTNRPKSVLVDPNNDILQIRKMPPLLENPSYDEVAYCVITDQRKADKSGWTPLHFAAQAGQIDIVEFLIAKGADVNAENLSGVTPLQFAADKAHKEIAELLIEKGADVSLHLAARLGDLPRVKSSVEDGADVNAEDVRGDTPLHIAAAKGHKEVVELLITKGANVNAKNNEGQTPIDIALEQNHKDIVALLLEKGAEFSIHIAAYLGDIDRTKRFIETGVSVDVESGPAKRTPLYLAVKNKHKDVAKLLIDKGANVSSIHLLYYACWYGYRDFVELFIQKGAEANSKNWGESPSHYAVWGGHADILELLLAKGADANAKDTGGWSLLHYTAGSGSMDMTKILLDKDVDVNAKENECGQTPLHRAAEEGHIAVAELLIANGADLNAKDNQSRTSLWLAKDKGHTEIVELLKKHGAKE